MIEIFVKLEDKKLESLIKVFIKDFYFVNPLSFEVLGSESKSSVLITDQQVDFKGYLIGLLPLSVEECRDKSKGRCFFLSQLDFQMYLFLVALDDTLNEIRREQGSIANDTFLMVPAKYSSLLESSKVQTYQKVGNIRFSKVNDIKKSTNENFYIERKKTRDFLEILKEFLISNIENENLETKERVFSAHDLANIIGISETTLKSVDKLASELTRDLIKISDLKSYIDTLLFKKDDYINILKLTLYCAVDLCRSDSSLSEEKYFKKIVTAGLLMDSHLSTEDEKLCLDIDDSLEKFSRDQRNMIKEHTVRAAQKLSQYNSFGQDELLLIERHHERPDGAGFPRGLTQSKMTILQNLFITSYRFSHHVISETKRKGAPSSEIIKRVSDKMYLEGFGEGQTFKFLSKLLKKSNDDA